MVLFLWEVALKNVFIKYQNLRRIQKTEKNSAIYLENNAEAESAISKFWLFWYWCFHINFELIMEENV